jgi:hypothetical protein
MAVSPKKQPNYRPVMRRTQQPELTPKLPTLTKQTTTPEPLTNSPFCFASVSSVNIADVG